MASIIGIGEMSKKLQKFKDSYEDIKTKISSAREASDQSLGSIANEISSVIDTFKTAGDDSVISSIVADTELAKMAVDRVNVGINDDIGNFLGGIEAVMGIVSSIETVIEEARSLANTKPTEEEAIKALNGRLGLKNSTIESLNAKGEAQLNAIAGAMSSINFGVKGNMKSGSTSLGARSSFAENYLFTWEDDGLDGISGDGEKSGKDTKSGSTTFYSKAHIGDNIEVSTPKNMRELKIAMEAGQPIILSGIKLEYDPGTTMANEVYDGMAGDVYLVKTANNVYKAVDKDGNIIDNNKYIKASRIIGAGDESEHVGKNIADRIFETGVNHTGIIGGEEVKLADIEKTGEDKDTLEDIKAGDAYTGDKHKGSSKVVAEPQNMRELKDAMYREQPIKISGRKFYYHDGGLNAVQTIDGKSEDVYLIIQDGDYYAVNENGRVINGTAIKKSRVFESGDYIYNENEEKTTNVGAFAFINKTRME